MNGLTSAPEIGVRHHKKETGAAQVQSPFRILGGADYDLDADPPVPARLGRPF
jgi:hypothetical protein